MWKEKGGRKFIFSCRFGDGDLQDQQESFRAIRFRSHSPTGFTRRAQSSSLFGFIPLSVFVPLIPDPL